MQDAQRYLIGLDWSHVQYYLEFLQARPERLVITRVVRIRKLWEVHYKVIS